ncbi:hypothetical protein IV500_05970 [Paeniglutamicibacter antarcticus]|uniref:Uncharacterized protein n=1 Tax=Arthrobacter terrae TaxID=2935737 RepID=A0A931CQ62_9MICC|nr:hypothetical protein [Arthrobacter terrae]MBG0738969.1 hypothetical protein [Arthrobacter terrae]
MTEQKPYDEVVTAIPIPAAVRLLASEGRVRSDGRWDNWAVCGALFGKTVRPLTEDEKIALELDIKAIRPEPAPMPTKPA